MPEFEFILGCIVLVIVGVVVIYSVIKTRFSSTYNVQRLDQDFRKPLGKKRYRVFYIVAGIVFVLLVLYLIGDWAYKHYVIT